MTSDNTITIDEPGEYRIESSVTLDAPMQREPLTRQQRITYDALVDYIRANGYPPTVRELADTLGLSSASAATARLHALRDRGWITMTPKSPRAITIVDA